jgi:hypothetical protein
MAAPNKPFKNKKSKFGVDGVIAGFKSAPGNSHVFAGFLRSSGMHKQEKGDPLTVATVAMRNEFGFSGKDETTGEWIHIPERSFMRSAMKENKKKLKKMLNQLAKKVLHQEMDTKKALNIVGLKLQTMFRQKIETGPFKPNSPVTIILKGSDKPLIDTGQMLGSIDFEVKTGGKK